MAAEITGNATGTMASARPGMGQGQGAGQGAGVPVPVMLFLIFVVLVPIELGFEIGPLFFTWSKFFIIVMAVPILLRAVAELKLQIYDWALAAHAVWTLICMVLNISGGVEQGGTYFLEFAVIYFMARLYLQSLARIRATIGLLFVLALICSLAAIPEALLHQRFIHDWASAITGRTYHFSDEGRLGLLRAASFFEHPILHGLFVALTLALVWYIEPRPFVRLVMAGLIATGTFFGLSSAPMLVVAVQLGLIGLDWATRGMKARVGLFAAAGLSFALLAEYGTGRGFVGVVSMFTLSPHTSFYRLAQFQFASDDVMRNPIFGLDPVFWTRPYWLSGSIDNHWLLVAVRSGFPGLILLLFAIWAIWRRLGRDSVLGRPPLFAQLRLGWRVMIVAMLLGGATVAYFGRMQPILAFLIGIGAALASNREVLANADPLAGAPEDRGRDRSGAKMGAKTGTKTGAKTGPPRSALSGTPSGTPSSTQSGSPSGPPSASPPGAQPDPGRRTALDGRAPGKAPPPPITSPVSPGPQPPASSPSPPSSRPGKRRTVL